MSMDEEIMMVLCISTKSVIANNFLNNIDKKSLKWNGEFIHLVYLGPFYIHILWKGRWWNQRNLKLINDTMMNRDPNRAHIRYTCGRFLLCDLWLILGRYVCMCFFFVSCLFVTCLVWFNIQKLELVNERFLVLC